MVQKDNLLKATLKYVTEQGYTQIQQSGFHITLCPKFQFLPLSDQGRHHRWVVLIISHVLF